METKNRQTFDYDTEKASLIRKSNLLEGDIEQDIDKIKGYVQEYGKNALIITGSLLATYVVLRLITKNSDDVETTQSQPNQFAPIHAQPVIHVVKKEDESPILKQIKSSITLFLISIAKQKLLDFLASHAIKEKSE